jgi:hypothetical protein
MTPGDIPAKYQGIIDHAEYLVLKVSRLEAEIIQLRRQLSNAYGQRDSARDTAALLEVIADAGLGLAYSGACDYCDSHAATELNNCPDKHGWHSAYNQMADVLEHLQ